MEIIDPCCCLLTNCEVINTLKNTKDGKKRPGLRNLATVTYETLHYLEQSCPPFIVPHCVHQTRGSIELFLKKVERFNLTENECLNMVNNPPTTALHIQLLVDDSEERLSEEDVEHLLEIVNEHLIAEMDTE